jgi:hypothetical protein
MSVLAEKGPWPRDEGMPMLLGIQIRLHASENVFDSFLILLDLIFP